MITIEYCFDTLRDDTKARLSGIRVSEKDVLAVMYSDLLSDGHYGESAVVALKDGVVAINGDDLARYYYRELTDVKTEHYVSTGMLVLHFKSGPLGVAMYTNARMRSFGHLAELMNKARQGKKLTNEDYESDVGVTKCPTCGRRFADQWRKVCPKCMNKRALLLRVLAYAPRYKREIFIMLVAIVAGSSLNLIRPIMTGTILFDNVLKEGGTYYGMLLPYVGVLLAAELTAILFSIIQGRTTAGIAAKVVYDIKMDIFSNMQKLSMSFYNSKQTGSLMTRVNDDALNIQYFLNEGLVYFCVNGAMVIGVGIIMAMYNPLLALLVFVPVPLIILIVLKKIPEFWRLRWFSWVKRSRLNSFVNDSLTGMRVVKAFGKEGTEIDRFEENNMGVFRTALNEGKAAVKTFPLLSYIMSIGGLLVWGFGGSVVLSGNMTFGVLITFIGYIGMLYQPVEFMMYSFNWWTDCMNSAQRVFEIIDRQPDVKEAKNPTHIGKIKGEIVFNHMTYGYEPNKPILHDINLHIKPGEMLGVVGHSGAGKSTITALVTRLYDVNEGSITIDGVDLRKIAIDDLRRQIGYVLQETYLFTATVADNIKYAKPDATFEEVVAAAKLAGAHDFIMKLPDGYETMLSRKRHNFSGGERQRISIARAILINPRILILDEATASVDTETERKIQEAMEVLVKGRTTIAIAHRLSTLRNADRIIVMDKGRIAEIGTHAELEAKKGIYYNMMQLQKEALAMRTLEHIEGQEGQVEQAAVNA